MGSTSDTHDSVTSAAEKLLGFDFQYLYFIYRLLSLKSGQSIGFEVLDDVHLVTENDRLVLVQVKHTLKKATNDSPANLTTLDADQWKTFYNWSKIITDPNAGRGNTKEQVGFVSNADFILVSNKSLSTKNALLQALDEFKKKNSMSAFRGQVQKILASTENDKIKDFIREFLDLDDVVLAPFLNSIVFDLGQEEILSKCREAIKEKMVPENKVDDVLYELSGHVFVKKFEEIKKGNRFEISFDEIYRQFRRIFGKARNDGVVIQKYEAELPDRLEEQTFIKQLLDIKDIKLSDNELMAEYTRFKLMVVNNFERWQWEGDITSSEVERFNADAIQVWKNEFRKQYRDTPTNEVQAARDILDKMREEALFIDQQRMGRSFSNGQYYRLSDDEPLIGWLPDWEKKYKKNDE